MQRSLVGLLMPIYVVYKYFKEEVRRCLVDAPVYLRNNGTIIVKTIATNHARRLSIHCNIEAKNI